jgi:hypothetical protein
MSTGSIKPWGSADWLRQAQLVEDLMAQVERYLAGELGRVELLRWAQSMPRWDPQSAFRSNGYANGLLKYIEHLDAVCEVSGDPLIRRSDLVDALGALRRGEPHFTGAQLAILALSAAEVAKRAGVETVRWDETGIGWWEGARFASRATGRPFCAIGPLPPCSGQERQSWVRMFGHPESSAEHADVTADLFDTLCIDEADTIELSVRPSTRWDLMRQDDNGHSFLVGSFGGYAKACARLAAFESTHHKQSYWLEQRTDSAAAASGATP